MPEIVSEKVTAAMQAVAALAEKTRLDGPTVNMWLCEVLGRFPSIAARLAPDADVEGLRAKAQGALDAKDFGAPLDDETVLESAQRSADQRSSDEVQVRDLVQAVLEQAGADIPSVGAAEPAVDLPPADGGETDEPVADVLRVDELLAATSEAAETEAAAAAAMKSAAAEAAKPPRTKPTPTLDKFGRDLTAEARAGRLRPALGRDGETRTLVEVLCRTQKRNPLLIGPAGSGKTAIVESFACRVASGDVPAMLRDARIVALETTMLISGTSMAGSFEERLQKVVDEASQPGLILFIDEAHTVASAGNRGSQMADALKPALARGELALIAATTDDEYREYFKPDRALERRFHPVPVTELGPAATLKIMHARRDWLAEQRKVRVPDDILEDLVSFAEANMRNRTFPDKALDLLEQCVAFAMADRLESVDAQAEQQVLARVLGDDLSTEQALEQADSELTAAGFTVEDEERIMKRLATTLNGLDLRVQRPNLVLALSGGATREADAVARTLARALYGADERVIHVDLSPIQEDEAISILIGSIPGTVGYGRRLPIHELEVAPRTVVVLTGADVCHPIAADIVAKGLADGYITDTTGGRYYMSDAVVLLPTSREGGAAAVKVPFGFKPAGCDADESSVTVEPEDLCEAFGRALAEQVDVCVSELGMRSGAGHGDARVARLLPDIAAQYARRGITLTWDDAVAAHLGVAGSACATRTELERLVEEWVSGLVLGVTGDRDAGESCAAHLSMVDGAGQAVLDP